jgi:transcriptional regulator with XRE-family HTH domain
MNNFHQPLKLPADRRIRINRALAADEGCIAVGGLAAKLGQLSETCTEWTDNATSVGKVEVLSPATGLVVISRLVQLARREARQSPEQFAKQTSLSLEELQAIEAATRVPEPRVLYSISEALDISYQKLLTLAGHRKQRDNSLEREALKFAASSAPMDKLSKTEAEALHDFLSLLHD